MSRDAIILFVHQSSELYGSDRVLLMLVIALKARGGFHPVVVLPDTGPLHDEFTRAGIETHVGSVGKISRAMFSPRGLVRLVGAVRRGLSDLDKVVRGRPIAVVHSNTVAVLTGAIWAWRRKVPHVWHVHEIIVSPRPVSKAFPRLVGMFSEGVIANSRQTKAWLVDVVPSMSEKCHVMFNGLPPVVIPKPHAVQQFRLKVGAGEEDVVVTLVGRISRTKGQDVLIEAAGLLKSRGQLGTARVVIVGSTAPGAETLVSELQARIDALGLTKQAIFVDFDADVWPVWFGSDVGVVPSTGPEAFGMVAIEAMAAGLPVIAAAHGGLLDIVVPGKTGLHVAPGDAESLAAALLKLLQDKPLRSRLGQAGLVRQAQQFSLDAQVELAACLYRDLARMDGAVPGPCATT